MIEVRHLRKQFGSTVAVDRISFRAPDGVVTGLVGPNGAGKTTTLRMLAGLVRPDAGQVLVDGLDVATRTLAARARLGVLPEAGGLYDRLTVREHLDYAASLHGLSGGDLRRRVDAAIDRCGLGPLVQRPGAALSLGQRRRVALARALVHAPANVVLDEPTNGLDVPGVRAMRDDIRRLAGEGRAVILSTHVMPEIAAVCDRIVVLARGVVVAEGTPADLLARTGAPTLEDAFVAAVGTAEGLQ